MKLINTTTKEGIMITTYDIETAKTHIELDELVETAAADHNCELDNSATYAENAKWFDQDENRDGCHDLAIILRAAEKRWFELED